MTIRGGWHRHWSRALIDQAVGLLPSNRQAALRRHVGRCAACRDEQARLGRSLRAADAGPGGPEPPVPLSTLVSRVRLEIDRREKREPRRPVFLIPALLAAAALAIAAVLPLRPAAAPEVKVAADALDRMERTVGREQTARYLHEAQGVLLSVTTTLPRCDRATGRRTVAAEAEKSRELLVRRRLLFDTEAEHLAAARPVLEDVARALGEVASLDACAGPAELQSLARRIAQQRLLMKMDLMARELQG